MDTSLKNHFLTTLIVFGLFGCGAIGTQHDYKTIQTQYENNHTSHYRALQKTPQLLFKSSFNGDIEIQHKKYTTIISGKDSLTGFTWPNDLPGKNSRNIFNFIVNDSKNLTDYVDAKIVTINQEQKKALHIEFKKDDPNHSALSRVQYNLWADQNSNSPADRLEQIYIKYKIKLHIEQGKDTWRNMMEWRSSNEEHRWVFVLETRWNGDMQWRLHSDYLYGGKKAKSLWWSEVNRNIEVPLDKWFELEVFWKFSSGQDGKIWIAVNGQTIIERRGPNKLTKNMRYWNPFKIYGARGTSLITDVEIWDDIPIKK